MLGQLPDGYEDIVNLLNDGNVESLHGIVVQTIAQLQNFSWPGNVRQLRNVIEGLVVMATGNEIAPAHLPEEIRQIPSLDDSLSIKPGISIAEMEKRLIESTLLAENGNKAKAARILGMGRKTLYRKLQEYGING